MSRALAWFALAAVLTAPLGFGQATYTFDEGGGTTARDSSGTGLGGSIAGATYVSGYRGTALHFRGGTDRVTVPERVFSAFRNTAYFEAWIRPASQARMCCANPESGVIVFAKRAGYNDWAMELMRDGSLRATLYNAAGSDAVVARSKAGAIPLNTWTKVAMWYDGASMRLLVNDLETARTDKAFALDWSRDYITTEIGNDTYDIGSPCGDCDRAFVGDIDEVVISPAPPASEAKRGGWSELFPRNAPPARLWHAMAFDGAKIVLFGGFHAPVYVNNTWEFKIFDDTWTWDGVDWAEASVATRPPARFRHAMAYDEARRQVVLFGGYDNSFMNDTWVWDGRTWTKKTPANSPSPRGWHAMAYDAARRQVVLFGGTNDAFTHGLNDTWVWDGTNWQRKSVSVQPQAQFAHAMAYDPVRSRVVLIGREGDLPDDPKTALWTWDGQAWTRYAGASVKPARAGLAAAFDGPRSQVLIYGGGSMVREDTTDVWAWDGAALNQLPAATTPGERHAVMAYDAVRRQVVFFGGDPWERGLDDTWIWADAASLGKPSIVSFSPMSLPPGGELTVTGAGFSEERPWSKYPSNKVTLRLGDVEYPAPVTAVAPGSLTAFIPPVIRDGSNQWYRGPVQVCVSVDGQQTCAPDRLNIEPAAVPDAPPGRTLLDFSRKANQSGVDVLIRAGLAADAAEVQSVARAFDQQLSELVNAAVEGRPQLIRVPDGSGQMVDVPFELSAIRAVESLLVAYEKSRTAAAQSEHAAEGLARNRPAADCPLTDEQRRMEAKTAKDQLELTGGVLAVAGLAASVTGAVAACGTVVACPAALVAMQVAVPILITAAEWGVFAAEMNLQTRGSNLLVKVNPPDHVRLQTGAAASVALTAEFGNLTGPENRYEWVRKICTEFVSKVVTWGFSELVPKEFLQRFARPAVDWIIGKTSGMWF